MPATVKAPSPDAVGAPRVRVGATAAPMPMMPATASSSSSPPPSSLSSRKPFSSRISVSVPADDCAPAPEAVAERVSAGATASAVPVTGATVSPAASAVAESVSSGATAEPAPVTAPIPPAPPLPSDGTRMRSISVSDQGRAVGEWMTGSQAVSQAPFPGKVPLDLLPDSGAGDRRKDHNFSDISDHWN